MLPVYVALVPLAILLVIAVVVLARGRRRRPKARAAREPSGFVILEGNLWDACSVDELLQPWGRFTTEPVRGFCGVPGGRHRIRTTTASGEATLDFVIYPGEVLAWRLDPGRARWEVYELDPDTRSLLEGAPISSNDLSGALRPKLPGWLVHLRTTIGIGTGRVSRRADPTRALRARPDEATRGAARADDGVERLRKRLARLVALVEEGRTTDLDPLSEARGIGESILGRPLARREIRALVQAVRDAANRSARSGDVERTMRVLALGLAVFPQDPELMVIAGCALAMRGDADEALRILNAALERDRCLEAEDVARAMRARMELRGRIGRVRV